MFAAGLVLVFEELMWKETGVFPAFPGKALQGLCLALGIFESLLVSLQASKDLCKPSGILGNWTESANLEILCKPSGVVCNPPGVFAILPGLLQNFGIFASCVGSLGTAQSPCKLSGFFVRLWESLQFSWDPCKSYGVFASFLSSLQKVYGLSKSLEVCARL